MNKGDYYKVTWTNPDDTEKTVVGVIKSVQDDWMVIKCGNTNHYIDFYMIKELNKLDSSCHKIDSIPSKLGVPR